MGKMEASQRSSNPAVRQHHMRSCTAGKRVPPSCRGREGPATGSSPHPSTAAALQLDSCKVLSVYELDLLIRGKQDQDGWDSSAIALVVRERRRGADLHT